MEKRRARKEEDKQQRYQHILAVARQLYETGNYDYDAVTMLDIANQAELSKGAVYLYFKTKEELFLALVGQQFEDWFDAVDTRLQSSSGLLSSSEAAQLVGASLENRTTLIRLMAILHSTIERNIDFEIALNFKRRLAERVYQTSQLVEARLPFLRQGEGIQLLLRIYALVIGLEHMSNPAPIVRQVWQVPELALFEVDFVKEFTAMLQVLLQGLESNKKE